MLVLIRMSVVESGYQCAHDFAAPYLQNASRNVTTSRALVENRKFRQVPSAFIPITKIAKSFSSIARLISQPFARKTQKTNLSECDDRLSLRRTDTTARFSRMVDISVDDFKNAWRHMPAVGWLSRPSTHSMIGAHEVCMALASSESDRILIKTVWRDSASSVLSDPTPHCMPATSPQLDQSILFSPRTHRRNCVTSRCSIN